MRKVFALLIIGVLLFGCGAPKTGTVNSEMEKEQLEAQNKEYLAELDVLGSIIEYVCGLTNPEKEEREKQDSQLAIVVSQPFLQVKPGGTAELEVRTQPGAICFIAVCYESGLSTATGLTKHSPQEVDQNGQCSWQWRVGGNTKPGEWPIVVTAYLNGKICTLKTSIKVD